MNAMGPDGSPRLVPPGSEPALHPYQPGVTEPAGDAGDQFGYEPAGFPRPEPSREGVGALHEGPSGVHERAEAASIGELVSDVTRDLSLLLRQEVELAKAEAKDSAAKAGKGAGMLSGAAMAGWFTLLFLSLAVWEWLSGAFDNRGWAAIVVMVVWAIVAAVLAVMGRRNIKDIQGMSRTVETAKQVPQALKGNEEKL